MSKLSAVVSKIAPTLGSVLNLAFPGSGLLISGLSALFGLGSDASEEDLAKSIAANPEAYLKLKQFELQHKTDLENILAQDRASARNMAIETTKVTGKRDWLQGFFSVSFVLFAFYIFSVVAFGSQEDGDRQLINFIAEQVFAFLTGIGGFFFAVKAHSGMLKKNTPEEIEIPPPAETR